MNRRTFLQTITVAAGAVVLPWKFTNAEERNWRDFRERLRNIVSRGYEIDTSAGAFTLEAPHDGFRFARVSVLGGSPLTWNQPWNEP